MTTMTDFQHKILELLPSVELRFEEPMAKHTSFRIGGPVEVMAFPKNAEELSKILKASALLDCKPAILGAGTNILAPDEGLRGLVICLKDCLDFMEQTDATHIRVAAGVSMARCATYAANLSLSGLEFAHGIPGSVGGGVYMNAGAYGGEMKDVVLSTSSLRRNGMMRDRNRETLGFGYRTSAFQESDEIIIGVKILLKPGHPYLIQETMQDLLKKRNEKQPVNMPSAGSFFKRPEGHFAGKLIEDAGLKGLQVGGARVSPLHAGFVVNEGGATATDILNLMKIVQETVKDKFDVNLEPEVRIIG